MLCNCFEAMQHWLDVYGLSMNPDKTEAMFVGTSARQRTSYVTGTVDLGQVNLTTSHSVQSLVVIIYDTILQ